MKFGSLIWTAAGEGEVRLNDDFKASDWIVRADALKDWIAELQEQYDQTLREYGTKDPAPGEKT